MNEDAASPDTGTDVSRSVRWLGTRHRPVLEPPRDLATRTASSGPGLRLEDDRLKPAGVGNVELDVSVVSRQRDDMEGRDDDLRGDPRGIGVPFVDEHDRTRRAVAPRAGHFDREPGCGTLAGKDRGDHPGFEIDRRRSGVRACVRRPDGAERLAIADEEAARLDESAVVASRDGLDISHQRTVNSTSRAAVAPFDRSDFASTRST